MQISASRYDLRKDIITCACTSIRSKPTSGRKCLTDLGRPSMASSASMARFVRWCLLSSCQAKFICRVCCIAVILVHTSSSQQTSSGPTSASQAATNQRTSPAGSQTSILALPDRNSCVCDLSVGLCDLRCCCDPDCSIADRAVFSSCSDVAPIRADQSCVSSSLVVDSNSAYQTVRDDSTNLFCVSVDNNPARLSYVTPDRVNDAATFRQLISNYGDPAVTTLTPSALTWQRSYYRSGDPILVLSPPNVQGWLAVATSFGASRLCSDHNPVSFLVDVSTRCRRRVENLQALCTNESALSANAYSSNFRVARSPSLLEVILSAENDTAASSAMDGSGNDTLSVYDSDQLLSISVSTVRCRTPSGNIEDCPVTASSFAQGPVFNATSTTCEFILEEAHFLVLHNNTGGIESVSVDVVLGFVSAGLQTIEQQFTYTFRRSTESPVFIRSGNPGYLLGSAVLAGRLRSSSTSSVVAFNETTNVTVVNTDSYIELSSNPSDWLSAPGNLPSATGSVSSSVDCVTLPLVLTAVRFGEDHRTGCLLHYDAVNITQSCSVLQSISRSVLSAPSSLTHVAEYGNSLPNDTAGWVEILQESVSLPAGPQSTLLCPNVRIGLNLEVLYAKTGRLASPQLKVIGVRYTYIHATLHYLCYNSRCTMGGSPSQSVDLVSSTTFTEVAAGLRPQLRDIPETGGLLPYDFFYPFVNSGGRAYSPFVLLILVSIVMSTLVT